MKYCVLSICCIVGVVSAVGPLISDGWTPVIGSKAVKLPLGYVEPKQAPIKIARNGPLPIDTAQDRSDESEPVIQEIEREEDKELEQEKEQEKPDKPEVTEEKAAEKQRDESLLVVYPEGYQDQRQAIRPGPRPNLKANPRFPPPPPRRRFPPQSGRQSGPPPLRKRPLPRRPPPPGRLPPPPPGRLPPPPRPRPEEGGIFSKLGDGLKCLTEDVAADFKLNDREYMMKQIKCVLNEGPCDKVGINLKRIAPEVMRGLCPRPCNRCKQQQIRKIMATLARDYPFEWGQMTRIFG